MKIKTCNLIDIALDWAVAQCADLPFPVVYDEDAREVAVSPSTDWAQGGPIIEREFITVRPVFHAERTEGGSDIYRQDGWAAHVEPKAFWVTPRPIVGPTPLIAAMRCFVASKLGDEVEIPTDLL